jgi:hypothetical protein
LHDVFPLLFDLAAIGCLMLLPVVLMTTTVVALAVDMSRLLINATE